MLIASRELTQRPYPHLPLALNVFLLKHKYLFQHLRSFVKSAKVGSRRKLLNENKQ